MKIKSIKVKIKENGIPVLINTPFITLDKALKYSDIVSSGGQAKILISEGQISVNNEVCLMRGKKLRDGDTFSYNNQVFKIKSE